MEVSFSELVPGFSAVASRRNRRLKAHQVDPDDEDAVNQMMNLSQDEMVIWEEE